MQDYSDDSVVESGHSRVEQVDGEFNNGSSKHFIKAVERLTQLRNLSMSGKLGLNDLDVVDALINDLENVINLFN